MLQRLLTRRAREDDAARRFVWAIRESGFTWDTPTGYTGLADRTDTVAMPRIVLAGTVTDR